MADEGRELSWDDSIEKDGGDYILLPEGDYDFVIIDFERGRHNGSDKLPPCNKATIKLQIDTAEGSVVITHNLFLHSKCEGLLSSFFSAIGQKKKGERCAMNWNTVIGSRGKAKIGVHKYTNKDGEERQSNQVLRFYPKEVSFKAGVF